MSLLNGIKSFKSKLTRIGTKEPLNFLSIVLILGLDLFVLVNLFQGLDLQTRQLESPREIIPYECINLIQDIETNNDKESTVFNALDRNNDYYFNIENKYSADFINEKNKDKIDPKCREIFDAAINPFDLSKIKIACKGPFIRFEDQKIKEIDSEQQHLFEQFQELKMKLQKGLGYFFSSFFSGLWDGKTTLENIAIKKIMPIEQK